MRKRESACPPSPHPVQCFLSLVLKWEPCPYFFFLESGEELETSLRLCVYVCVFSHSVVSNCATPWTVNHQAPLSMGFPGKNTGEGCHFLLQGIFLTQGSNLHLPCLLRCRQILYLLSHQAGYGQLNETSHNRKSETVAPDIDACWITWLSPKYPGGNCLTRTPLASGSFSLWFFWPLLSNPSFLGLSSSVSPESCGNLEPSRQEDDSPLSPGLHPYSARKPRLGAPTAHTDQTPNQGRFSTLCLKGKPRPLFQPSQRGNPENQSQEG